MKSFNSCPFPWSSLLLNFDGGISFCCFHPAIANIKLAPKLTFEEVWNGPIAQQLRRKWQKRDLRGTPCANCLGLRMFEMYDYPVKNMDIRTSDISANLQLNFKEFNDREIIMKSMPIEIYYIPGVSCNINCVHCFQPTPKNLGGDLIDIHVLFYFYKHFGKLGIRNVFAGGEPLYMRQTYELINQFDPAHKAAAEAVFETNGQLVKDKFNSVKGFGRYSFLISIASFRKKIYEMIHRGAKLERLLENLEFLNSLRGNNVNISIKRMMVLMKSNFQDLESIFYYNQLYGFDETWVMPIQPAYGRFSILRSENIFDLPYLLEHVPNWHCILQKSINDAELLENNTSYRHLKYIRGRLSSSVTMNRLLTIRNSLIWWLRNHFTNISMLSPKVQQKCSK